MYLSNINNDKALLVKPYLQGVKLVRPVGIEGEHTYTLDALLRHPFCVYFNNPNSVTQAMNESAQMACGFDSLKDSLNTTMLDFAKKDVAQRVMNRHQQVMKTQRLQFAEDEVLRLDDHVLQCVSILLPWYSHENKVVGVAGFTIVQGEHALASSLQALADLGILHRSSEVKSQQSLSSLRLEGIHLSTRETQCLEILIQGYANKQIAAQLHLSTRTVEHYVESIRNKVGVANKAELIVKVMEILKRYSSV